MIEAIEAFAEREGRAPTSREFDRAAKADGVHPPKSAVIRRFGKWNRGLEVAGFEPHRRDWSRDEIVAALLLFSKRHGRAPRYTEWQRAPEAGEPSRPTATTAATRFGSWKAALEVAGVQD